VKRIAIVSPRCHEKIVGGAEALAWQYAQLLSDTYSVEVLASTASDYAHWTHDLPEGDEVRDRVTIRRFRVASERGPYFHELHRKLLTDSSAPCDVQSSSGLHWTEALQHEFIRAQGPVCPGLLSHLALHGDDYAAVLFVTYLYSTTYDGVRALPHRRWGLVPTLHDEPTAYFSVFEHVARRAPRLLWNTPAERAMAARIWRVDAGNIVAMTVATQTALPAREGFPYLLYCGRIDSHKGCAMLIDVFERYKRKNPSSLRLLLTGSNQLGVVDTQNVRYLGFVDESRKLSLMAGATAFVHPSPYESLSIVALEAMAQGTPIVVNGVCDVLADHVTASGSGFAFIGEERLHAAINAVLALDDTGRAAHSLRARDYVVRNYGHDQVRARLVAEVEALAAL
jgi:glycosyltransferase involved in cell wall biosynthesis